MTRWPWSVVERALAAVPPGRRIRIPKDTWPHPKACGAVASIGLGHGHLSDWRFPPDAWGRGLHVQEHPFEWEAHLDERHPDVDPLGHFVADVLGRR